VECAINGFQTFIFGKGTEGVTLVTGGAEAELERRMIPVWRRRPEGAGLWQREADGGGVRWRCLEVGTEA
jgi:hypothetical protein